MEALTVMSYWPCSKVFTTKSFLHNCCNFEEKGRDREWVRKNPDASYL